MKDINDRFGHLAGDEAICRMGRALRCLESKAITPVHISGDEFLAYGCTDSHEEAMKLPEYVKEELNRVEREDPWICNISISLGIYAAVPGPEDNIDTFMKLADSAMYTEKKRIKSARRRKENKV